MLRKARLAGRVTCCSVVETCAEEAKGSPSLMRVLAKVIEPRRSESDCDGLKDVGKRKKLRDHFLSASVSAVVDPFSRSSVRRLAVLGNALGLGGSNSGSICSKLTAGSFMSSRTSLIVNDACQIFSFRPMSD